MFNRACTIMQPLIKANNVPLLLFCRKAKKSEIHSFS